MTYLTGDRISQNVLTQGLTVLLCTILLISLAPVSQAQIRLQGAAADLMPDATNTFDIGANLGTLSPNGTILFHSFESFALPDASQTANFTNPNNIANIVGRVTGPGASLINGTVRVGGASTNFFFFNPNGISVGETAAFDVGGRLTLAAADALRFGQDDVVTARNPSASSLTVANPIDFGFLGGTLTLDGTVINLQTNPDGSVDGAVTPARRADVGAISLLGSQVSLNNTKIGINGPGTAQQFEIYGQDGITISGESLIDASATSHAGGIIVIETPGQFLLQTVDDVVPNFATGTFAESGIFARTENANNAGNVFVIAGDVDIRNEGALDTSTLGDGNAGNILINAGDGAVVFSGVIGTVAVNADGTTPLDRNGNPQRLDNAGRATTGTRGGGDSGIVRIIARNVRFQDNSRVTVNATDTSSGDVGIIEINADTATFQDNSRIFARAVRTAGRGGTVRINADTISILDRTQVLIQGSDSQGGEFILNGQSVTLSGPGVILSSRALGAAAGGTVTVEANSFTMQNGAEIRASASGQPGDAGNVDITADLVDIGPGTLITTSANVGAGGEIVINGNVVVIRGTLASNVVADTLNAGDITVNANLIAVPASANVTTRAIGDAGNIVFNGLSFIENFRSLDSDSETGQDGSQFFVDVTSFFTPAPASAPIPSDPRDLTQDPCSAAARGKSGIALRSGGSARLAAADAPALFLGAVPYPTDAAQTGETDQPDLSFAAADCVGHTTQ